MRVNREFSSKVAMGLETIEESKLEFLFGHMSEEQNLCIDEVNEFNNNLKKLATMDKNKSVDMNIQEIIKKEKIKLDSLRNRLAIGERQAKQGLFSNKTARDIIKAGEKILNAENV